ncbi:Hypothetical protein POVN_LOCUS558 [uncultured virus]|nr:Hypothetical protein POVN_LOCUS558 [uncultured virus]
MIYASGTEQCEMPPKKWSGSILPPRQSGTQSVPVIPSVLSLPAALALPLPLEALPLPVEVPAKAPTRSVVVQYDDETFAIEYDGKTLSINAIPVRMKTRAEMSEMAQEIYDGNMPGPDEEPATPQKLRMLQLWGSLVDFWYEDLPTELSEDMPALALVEAIIGRLYNGHTTARRYIISGLDVDAEGGTRRLYLPTTGSDFAGTDWTEFIVALGGFRKDSAASAVRDVVVRIGGVPYILHWNNGVLTLGNVSINVTKPVSELSEAEKAAYQPYQGLGHYAAAFFVRLGGNDVKNPFNTQILYHFLDALITRLIANRPLAAEYIWTTRPGATNLRVTTAGGSVVIDDLHQPDDVNDAFLTELGNYVQTAEPYEAPAAQPLALPLPT